MQAYAADEHCVCQVESDPQAVRHTNLEDIAGIVLCTERVPAG